MPVFKAEVLRQRGPDKGKSTYVRYFESAGDRTQKLKNNESWASAFFKGMTKGVAEGIKRDIGVREKPKFSIFGFIKRIDDN